MTSASWNSRSRVISVPVLAMSISKRCLRLKWSLQKITNRSQRKCHLCHTDSGRPTTVSESVSLSRTSIFALTPLLLSAFIRRLAATAAPPVRSLVLTISTLILQRYSKLAEKQKNSSKKAFLFVVCAHTT